MKISRRFRLLRILAGIVLLVGCKAGNGPIAPPGGEGLKAAFTRPDPNDCVVGKTLFFDASGSTDSLIGIAQYVWDWGDNTESSTNTTPGASHVFAKADTYRVTLTIIDQAGIKASTSQTVLILLPGTPPQACFSYQAPDGWQPGSVMKFDASCSSDVDSNISTYEWDWGDGSKPETFKVPTAEHAFVSENSFQVRVKVIDATGRETLSDPTEISIGHPSGPHVVASAENLGFGAPGYATSIAVSGNYAFVGASAGPEFISFLWVFDIQNPRSPSSVADLAMDGQILGIAIVAPWAYILAADTHDVFIDIVDITNPASPILKSKLTGFYYPYPSRIDAFGNYLLLAQSFPAAIRVFSTSDPANPVESGSLQIDSYQNSQVDNIVTSGSVCYASVRRDTSSPPLLEIVDFRNPSQMVVAEQKELDFSGNAYALTVSPDSSRLVAFGSSTVYKYDISEPDDPILTRELSSQLPGGATSILLSDSLYASDGSTGLYKLNLDAPGTQLMESAAAVPTGVSSIAVSGDYVLAASKTGGFLVVDFSPPGPKPVGLLDIRGAQAYGSGTGYLVLYGDFAYVSAGRLGLEVINISQPWNPAIERHVYNNSYAKTQAMAIHDHYLYLFNNNQFVIFDLANPEDPSKVGEGMLPPFVSYSQQLVVGDNYFCMIDSYGGFDIIDVSDPVSPQIVGPIKSGESLTGGAVYDSNLLIGDYSGIAVFDMSDPANPVKTRHIDQFGEINYFHVSGRYLYGYRYMYDEGYVGRLMAFDISDLNNPVLLGYRSDTAYENLAVLGQYAYIRNGLVGVQIVDLSDPANMHIVAAAPATLAAISYPDWCEVFRGR